MDTGVFKVRSRQKIIDQHDSKTDLRYSQYWYSNQKPNCKFLQISASTSQGAKESDTKAFVVAVWQQFESHVTDTK